MSKVPPILEGWALYMATPVAKDHGGHFRILPTTLSKVKDAMSLGLAVSLYKYVHKNVHSNTVIGKLLFYSF